MSVSESRLHDAVRLVLPAVLVLAMLAGTYVGTEGAQSHTSTTNVTLNIAEAIEVVSWPDADVLLGSSAVPGEESVSVALRFTVKCNAGWGVQVKSDETAGKLREYDTTGKQYVADGQTSQQALEWGPSPTGPWTSVSSTASGIATNRPATGEVGTTITYYLRYAPGFNDTPLGADRMYRIELTYTAAVGY